MLVIATTFLVIRGFYNKKSVDSVGFEKMVIPGPISTFHADYENDCEECHSPFDKESQNTKCIFCHEEVGKDLMNKSGYHGRSEQVSEVKCKSCHTEHKGRDTVLILLDKETFDHKFTDFELVGSHAGSSVSCESCHETDKKYWDTETLCFYCHENDDIHLGELGKECKECHEETLFKNVSYDHSAAEFSLEGKHKDVSCSLCHTNERYKTTPVDCIACHLINDIHDSKPDAKCERCHNSVDGWKEQSFDHNKETKFVLEDRHAELKCDSCHQRAIFENRLGLDCIDCHKEDDIHKGRTGSECEKCHDPIKWNQVRFDHDKDTNFELLGKHKESTCMDCHKDSSSQNELVRTCISCHRSDDVHQGKLGINCSPCHSVNKWGDQIKFEHDLTGFPLIGLHAITPCGECHIASGFKESLNIECFSCHQKDDGHEQKLGTYCAYCHNPNGWMLWEFDHNIQTEFKLEGSHEGISCQLCHTEPMETKVEVSDTCYSCHEENDVHLGRFGRHGEHCDLCHNFKEFKTIDKFHTTFEQEGLRDIEKDCIICHADDDIHNGIYGRLCDRCHTIESFYNLKREN